MRIPEAPLFQLSKLTPRHIRDVPIPRQYDLFGIHTAALHKVLGTQVKPSCFLAPGRIPNPILLTGFQRAA